MTVGDKARQALGLDTPPTTPTVDHLEPSTEIAVPAATSVTHRTAMGDKIQYAKALAEASLLPRAYQKQPGNVLLAIEMGEALQLHPYVAIQSIHVIEGKPTASAALISALVRRAGHRLRVSGDDEKAVAVIVRADDPDFQYRSEWTIARAQKAGLSGKGVWKTYPAAMLKARAITEVARDACQEALSGVQYTPEELGAQVDADGVPWTATTGVVAQDAAADWFGAIEGATDLDTLRDVYRNANAVGQLTQDLADRITAKSTVLAANVSADVTVDAVIVEDPVQTARGVLPRNVLRTKTVVEVENKHGADWAAAVEIILGDDFEAAGIYSLDQLTINELNAALELDVETVRKFIETL